MSPFLDSEKIWMTLVCGKNGATMRSQQQQCCCVLASLSMELVDIMKRAIFWIWFSGRILVTRKSCMHLLTKESLLKTLSTPLHAFFLHGVILLVVPFNTSM
mmetsp:Transcript_132462/g.264331  ORF Transcript_132462/g.264331 Transcript_132462/m.264331 type:complete len:102 (+) Transcript_132462:258-563(+)